MNIKTGLAVAAVIVGLGASSVAMEHGRDRDHDRDHGQFHRASWQHDDHDRKGYEKGKKTGWDNGALPPGQSKKESKEWTKEHRREGREHHHEMTRAQREAWEHRHHSHEAVVHKQPKPPYNAQKKGGMNTMVQAAKANKEHRKEVERH